VKTNRVKLSLEEIRDLAAEMSGCKPPEERIPPTARVRLVRQHDGVTIEVKGFHVLIEWPEEE